MSNTPVLARTINAVEFDVEGVTTTPVKAVTQNTCQVRDSAMYTLD